MPRGPAKQLSRRELLRGSLLASGALLTGFERIDFEALGQRRTADRFRGGKMIGTIDFTEEVRVPMGKAFGDELDGRMYTDLSKVTQENAVTPADEFYIRTRASKLLAGQKTWSVQVAGLVEKPYALGMADFAKIAKPMGVHLMECAGNTRQIHFGMMSVADWTGVSVAQVLAAAKLKPAATRVLISGFDRYATQSVNSIPGASWIFTLEELKAAGAFLATEMNGHALTPDHGAPGAAGGSRLVRMRVHQVGERNHLCGRECGRDFANAGIRVEDDASRRAATRQGFSTRDGGSRGDADSCGAMVCGREDDVPCCRDLVGWLAAGECARDSIQSGGGVRSRGFFPAESEGFLEPLDPRVGSQRSEENI